MRILLFKVNVNHLWVRISLSNIFFLFHTPQTLIYRRQSGYIILLLVWDHTSTLGLPQPLSRSTWAAVPRTLSSLPVRMSSASVSMASVVQERASSATLCSPLGRLQRCRCGLSETYQYHCFLFKGVVHFDLRFSVFDLMSGHTSW